MQEIRPEHEYWASAPPPEWIRRARELQLIADGEDPKTPENQAWLDRPSVIYSQPPKAVGVGRGGYRHGVPGGKRDYSEREIRPEGSNSVYRCYDAEGQLLYVGITAKGVWRARLHSQRSPWWLDVVRQEWEHFPTRQQALAREAYLIAHESPLHNKLRPPKRKDVDHEA